jgi:hypothetical protein
LQRRRQPIRLQETIVSARKSLSLNRFASKRLASVIFAGVIISGATAAEACDAVDLYKIISVRDEVLVGATEKEYAEFLGNDVSAVGRALVQQGQVTLWQYAVRKATDGELELAPLKRISVLQHDSLRIEPYATPLRVMAVPEEGVERDPQPRC